VEQRSRTHQCSSHGEPLFAFRAGAESASLGSRACDASVTVTEGGGHTPHVKLRCKPTAMAKSSTSRPRPNEPDRDDIVATFGANLKAARQKAGLTQVQLAERAGLLQQYISLVESGKQNVTLVTAKGLANVVKRDVRSLLAPLRTPPFKR
jgi:DNA-binding XRE family transcriptional regulator